jgi:beta-glucosidase
VPGYDPQFLLGYGLTYASPAHTPLLVEADVRRTSGELILFADGRFMTPWNLVLRDDGGEARVADGARGASPRSRVQVSPIDGEAQESARRLAFSGPGRAIITGPALELSAESAAGRALAVRFRIEQGVAGDFRLGFGDAEMDWPASAGPGWQQAVIPLRCFPGAVATSFSSVDRLLIVEGARASALAIEDVRLIDAPAGPCPAE